METNIQSYIDLVKNNSESKSYVVIYGAGRKAINLYNALQATIKIDAFIVTNKDENKDCECGLPIYGINDNPFSSDDTLFLIGVRSRWNKDVIRTLNEFGYLNYMESPEGIEYLGEKDADRSARSVLQLTLQIGCAINCKYCPQSLFVTQYKEKCGNEQIMSYEMFVNYINRVDNDVILEFAGFSEPFFNKDCLKMLEYANAKGYDIELFTTLQGISTDELERILKIPYREVVLHIPDEMQNSKIIVNEQYIHNLEKAINAKKENGKPFVDWGSCHGEPSKSVKSIIKNKIRLLTQLHNRAGNLGFQELEGKKDIKGSIQCSGTLHYDHNVLLPDGTILLCDSDWGIKHPIGNLKTQTYKEILKGDVVSEIKKRCSDEKYGELLCRNCCYAIPYDEVKKA